MAGVVNIGVEERLLLGHAAAQALARRADVRVLHIKGMALDAPLRVGRRSSDVDLLVDPAGVGALQRHLVKSGWQLITGFAEGSAFEHAATYRHPLWGNIDLHRRYPGFGVSPPDAFELLWDRGRQTPLAGVMCRVPDETAQRLILLLHAARSRASERMTADIRRAWHDASPAQRAEVQELATQLHAELGMSVILGRLDDYRGEPEYALWRSLSRGGTRLEEWWGRIRAARTWRERVVLIARLPLVNQQHLAAILGHKPSVRELIGEFFARPMRAIRSELGKRRGAAR